MKNPAVHRTLRASVLAMSVLAGLAYGVTYTWQFQFDEQISLSVGGNGHKPKIQRAGDGTLVNVYGDSAAGAEPVYDTKDQAERPSRDIYVRYCKPDSAKTCDVDTEWSQPFNLSKSAGQTSMSTAWKGTTDPFGNGTLRPHAGDADKPNIKTSGPVMVVTWVSAYCPDGDLQAPGIQPPLQRAVRYLEREERVIPFRCMWAARSVNSGVTWSEPIQLSNGERDAKQDSSAGTYDAVAKTGRIAMSWQEDPEGLQLGEGDGPGDGASGAKVTGGTDVWYTWATVNLAVPNTLTDDFVLAPPSTGLGTARALGHRLSDNWEAEQKFGVSGQINHIFDGTGVNVDPDLIEKGSSGASRANIGMVGGSTVMAYEETKGSEGLDEGKFVRYHNFPFNTPPSTLASKAGCLISDPLKNARRVRFLTQGATEAGPGGINLAIFWKEGAYDKGGPSDIVVRRGMVGPNGESGLAASRMVPAVDANCATSVYSTAIALTNQPAENISSRAAQVTDIDNGLSDNTERVYEENALAHRGVLRGNELWIGYNYTADLVKLWAQIDNYDFWLRKFTLDPATGAGSWNPPINVTNIAEKRISVREPRIFGTPPSNPAACPSGDPAAADTTDPKLCQNTNVVFLAWGSQENVSPFDPDGGEDLGVHITVSRDGGASFEPPVEYSLERGPLFGDNDEAFESQIVTRPDGTRFYGVWNSVNIDTNIGAAKYRAGEVVEVEGPDPETDWGDLVGCTMGNGNAPFDPTLLLLAVLGLAGIGLRRVRRR